MAARQPAWGALYRMPPAMTADDLLRLPDDGAKNELYEGTLVREEMSGPGHGYMCYRLGVMLGIYAQATGFPNIILQNGLIDFTKPGETRRTILAPDLSILRTSTPPPWNRLPTDPPLLAVEVVSPSQTLAELSMKAQFYRNAGVDEVWVIDHGTRVIEIWNVGGTTSLTDGQALTSTLLPGFTQDVTSLLDG